MSYQGRLGGIKLLSCRATLEGQSDIEHATSAGKRLLASADSAGDEPGTKTVTAHLDEKGVEDIRGRTSSAGLLGELTVAMLYNNAVDPSVAESLRAMERSAPFRYGHGTPLQPITEQRSIATLRRASSSSPSSRTMRAKKSFVDGEGGTEKIRARRPLRRRRSFKPHDFEYSTRSLDGGARGCSASALVVAAPDEVLDSVAETRPYETTKAASQDLAQEQGQLFGSDPSAPSGRRPWPHKSGSTKERRCAFHNRACELGHRSRSTWCLPYWTSVSRNVEKGFRFLLCSPTEYQLLEQPGSAQGHDGCAPGKEQS